VRAKVKKLSLRLATYPFVKMGHIQLNTIRVYAYHGCLSEETKIGSDYVVEVSVKADLTKAAHSDSLADTVDYVHLNQIVKREMGTPSMLLEHVANRIIDAIFNEIDVVTAAEISVAKMNPPIGGDVDRVIVTLSRQRE
jgi:dihydroneopterin aldolase